MRLAVEVNPALNCPAESESRAAVAPVSDSVPTEGAKEGRLGIIVGGVKECPLDVFGITLAFYGASVNYESVHKKANIFTFNMKKR